MWDRKKVKERGKTAFKKSYWKAVLVAIILAIVTGTASVGGSGGYTGGGNMFKNHSAIQESAEEDAAETGDDADKDKDDDNGASDDDSFEITIDSDNPEDAVDQVTEKLSQMDEKESTALIVIGVIVFALVFIIAFVVGAAIDILLFNPIQMGCNRFFYKNLDEDAGISNVVYAFDHNYKNIIKCLFYRDMYIVLWSLLFVIPGIVKGYEYRMIPFLLAENPDMTKEEVFEESKKLMTGNKWKAFVYDLSFIGWNILSILTCGILSIFFVNPYKSSADAALFEAIKYGSEEA